MSDFDTPSEASILAREVVQLERDITEVLSALRIYREALHTTLTLLNGAAAQLLEKDAQLRKIFDADK